MKHLASHAQRAPACPNSSFVLQSTEYTGNGSATADLGAVLDGLPFPADASTLTVAARRVVAHCPSLPQPGGGQTLKRWRFLAALAARDLPLVKIYEAHADAQAILAELGYSSRPTEANAEQSTEVELWAVWAARSSHGELQFSHQEGRNVRLSGTKSWCSGATFVTHALVTCVDDDGRDWLAILPMDQAGVRVSSQGWEAVGMSVTESVDVELHDARATLVGAESSYLHRPGFWHGGAGIAACWFGAAAALATRLRAAAARRDDPHLHAHLGDADAALIAARAFLRESACTIDAAPDRDPQLIALRTRAVVERAVECVSRACARGLGAGPLCRDAWFAHMSADLPVFVRQSHAEHDLAEVGRALRTSREDWQP
ncbi:acyl-CoA dehydrogenase family protein [Paraburkholderia bannensis]|uniref:acyl-CoA dehydrogenase n=1 Tax=Paraburkholderia bannensis TaxID=765414 RepID=UPI0012EB4B6F|nr:acyl-CoA dehydrogenase [Paraburkholderia bannensis]